MIKLFLSLFDLAFDVIGLSRVITLSSSRRTISSGLLKLMVLNALDAFQDVKELLFFFIEESTVILSILRCLLLVLVEHDSAHAL